MEGRDSDMRIPTFPPVRPGAYKGLGDAELFTWELPDLRRPSRCTLMATVTQIAPDIIGAKAGWVANQAAVQSNREPW